MATKYDGSAAAAPTTLRCQIGRSYDVKEVRNTWPATPLTSSCASSASPSTTPCARSPASSRSTTPTSAGVTPLRRQSGGNRPGGTERRLRSQCGQATSDNISLARSRCGGDPPGGLRSQCGEKPEAILTMDNHPSRRSVTMRAWLFGHEIRWQRGQGTNNPAMPNRPFLRRQRSW